MQALLLPLAHEWYAVDLASVRVVVPHPVITPLPRGPETVLGVFNLRGEVVPVLDTPALLGVGRLSGAAFVAVAETAAGPGGLAVDGVPRAATLEEAAGASELPGSLGRYAVEGRLVTLLDVEDLLSPARVGMPA